MRRSSSQRSWSSRSWPLRRRDSCCGGKGRGSACAVKYAIVFKNTGNPYADKQMGGFKAGIEEQGFQGNPARPRSADR